MRKSTFFVAGIAAIAGAANGQVIISEVLGSTGVTDAEFIEIGNIGAGPANIGGWSIELWDSNASRIPSLDGASPYTVPAGTILQSGETFVFGNAEAIDWYINGANSGGSTTWNGGGPGPTSFFNPTTGMVENFSIDQTIGGDSIENSAYTMILSDDLGNVIESWYFLGGSGDSTPADPGDFANRAGTPITPDVVVPTDVGGQFIQSGYAATDGGFVALNFNTPGFSLPWLNDGTVAGGTPGVLLVTPVPAPGAAAVLGLAGLAATRRRRA